MLRTAIVCAQGVTFVGLALVLAAERSWRLAAAQLLLAVVTWLVYA